MQTKTPKSNSLILRGVTLALCVILLAPEPTYAFKRIFLTSTAATTWTVVSDWSGVNTIEVVGGGGGGADAPNNSGAGAGGGGAYASTFNLAGLVAGNSITIQVGDAGAGVTNNNPGATSTDTFFNRTTGSATMCNQTDFSACAKGGEGGQHLTPFLGGSAGTSTSSFGTIKFSGGNGGGGNSGDGSGGGGGAAGSYGAGAQGGTANGVGGGGGGGADGGTAGQNCQNGTSGWGGDNFNHVGGGLGGTSGGGAATSSGAGGGGGTNTTAGAGGNGAIEWAQGEFGVAGSGGGGGGGSNGSTGGNGGLYGGGGGGGEGGDGVGQDGIIVLTYIPSVAASPRAVRLHGVRLHSVRLMQAPLIRNLFAFGAWLAEVTS